MEQVYEKGVDYGKDTNQYKLFSNIVSNIKTPEYVFAIPYFSLFDNIEYVDTIKLKSKKNIKYNAELECFLFLDFSECFYFCMDSFKTLYENFPEDSDIENKYNVYHIAMKMINSYIEIDDVYAKMCDLKL